MKICVGITGSIAAYRSPDLVKALVARGHDLRALPTASALAFVTPRTLETFSGHIVLSNDAFDPQHLGTDHIALARWSDVVLVYGATATFLARYATGMADDFLTLQLLATRAPVVVAPAMNPAMWEHPAVRVNVATLRERGVQFVEPIAGLVACGESGVGHVATIEEIVNAAESAGGHSQISLSADEQKFWRGQRVLISAGPMRSAIDPARNLQNRSSGQMGLALARAAHACGAEVETILGPVDSSVAREFEAYKVLPYVDSMQYGAALAEAFARCDVFFSAAAVLDFQVVRSERKLAREESGDRLTLPLRAVPDFVALCAQRRAAAGSSQKIVAFAAESATDESALIARAREKLRRKGADAIVANNISENSGPESARNEVWILDVHGGEQKIGPAPKSALGAPVLASLARLFSRP